MKAINIFCFLIMLCIVTTTFAQNSNNQSNKKSKKMTNLEIALKWGESTKVGDWNTYNALTSDDFQLIGPAPEPLGKEAYMTMLKSLLAANSQHDNNFEMTSHSENVFSGHVQMEGKHTGNWDLSFMGMGVISPTNKSWKNPKESLTVTVQNGKVVKCEVEVPANGGLAGIMSQLGLGGKN